MNTKISSRKIEPNLRLLRERFEFDELTFSKSEQFENSFIENAIDLTFNEFQPSVIAIEDRLGNWSVESGSHFVQALIEYINNKCIYPTDGIIADLQGKLFSEISRLNQRKILEKNITISLFDCKDEKEIEIIKKFISLNNSMI